MIRVAVCDDEEYICDTLKEYLLDYQFKYNYDFKVDKFLSCEELLERLKQPQAYHLILLDIEFPNMNGVELSRKLRDTLGDRQTQIVFISSKESYAMELFAVQPFDFMVKPITKEMFFPLVSKYIKYYVDDRSFFTYTYENMKHKLAINEILYVKSEGKKLRLYTFHGEVLCYHRFKDAVNSEMRNNLLVVKRGVAVNISHIVHTDFESVTLKDGTRLSISDSYRNSVMNALSDKIGGM